MGLKRIYDNLGLLPDFEKEIKKFNWRIAQLICEIEDKLDDNTQKSLFKKVLFRLGCEPPKLPILAAFLKQPSEEQEILRSNLLVLQIILEELKELSKQRIYRRFIDYKELYEEIEQKVNELFSLCLVDVGFTYKNGFIIQSGAKELDGKLIIEVLEWLKDYPTVEENFSNALRQYLLKHYKDAITNAYSSLESMAQLFLNTEKRLDNDKTRNDLINKLGLESYWGQILFHYCKIAHEFSTRHGKKKKGKFKLSPELVEFYIYLTGTFVRLISQRMEK